MIYHRTPGINEYPRMTTAELRAGYLLGNRFEPGSLELVASDLDRAVLGMACPDAAPLRLEAPEAMRAEFFCERRELGVINLGETGAVEVDGATIELTKTDILYIGRGAREVVFSGNGAAFELVSFPAHAEYPTAKAVAAEANVVELGSPDGANERVIRQYIHPGGLQSCQLVMGWTEVKPGSVWNTMPPHTHERRCEIYTYFDVPRENAVLHLMGQPTETRPLWVRERETVLSPPWSIHCGAGTAGYRFVWAMGGENQRFDDMDGAPIDTLR